jgi:hypothetical protein
MVEAPKKSLNMPERSTRIFKRYQITIEGVEGNLTKADCPVHGKNVYFERVKKDFFRCANFEHKPLNERQRIPDEVPGRLEK